jgi:hypothetical protein
MAGHTLVRGRRGKHHGAWHRGGEAAGNGEALQWRLPITI